MLIVEIVECLYNDENSFTNDISFYLISDEE